MKCTFLYFCLCCAKNPQKKEVRIESSRLIAADKMYKQIRLMYAIEMAFIMGFLLTFPFFLINDCWRMLDGWF
jgi:hypothetical protein